MQTIAVLVAAALGETFHEADRRARGYRCQRRRIIWGTPWARTWTPTASGHRVDDRGRVIDTHVGWAPATRAGGASLGDLLYVRENRARG
jgi:hypothetical protein